MKINTLTRYGLRAILEISLANENNPISIKELAIKQNLSEKYLETIVAKLKRHKLVASKKGKFGGYFLIKKFDNISLYDIFFAMEGELKVVNCVDDKTECDKIFLCKTNKVWKNLNKKIISELKNIKLKSLL